MTIIKEKEEKEGEVSNSISLICARRLKGDLGYPHPLMLIQTHYLFFAEIEFYANNI